MKLKKKDVKRILELLDEMIEMLDEIRTPRPRVEEDDYRWATKLVLDLRSLHMKNHGKPPKNLNLDPATVAGILSSSPSLTGRRIWDGQTQRIRIFGMNIHTAASGRGNWEMW